MVALKNWIETEESAEALACWRPGATHPAGDYLLSTTAADSKTYTYDANGNLTSDRVRTFLWDADGAREREDGAPGSGVPGAKQRVSKAGAPGATDEQNRLISIIEASKKSKFSYDGLGRRVRIRELDRGTETSNRTFVWSGTAIVEERNAAGTQASKRYYARGLVDRTGSEDKKYYYTFDHLGSIREVVEDDGTTVAARYDYDPFGRVEKLGGSYDVDFLYTGHFYHRPSGLHLTLYRAYDPDTGVWLSRDPLGYIDGPNPYAYVGNDPLGKFDPTGGAARCIKSQSDNADEFLSFIRNQGIERKWWEDVIVERIAENLDDIPEGIRNWEPDDVWGRFVDDKGNHLWNQRLPGGYHLSVDRPNGPVNLHQDAMDPLKGPLHTYNHWQLEVQRINTSDMKEVFVDNNPDWPLEENPRKRK